MEFRHVPISKLRLDTANPRHGQVDSQRDAIQALIAREGSRLVALARDIAENGLNPTERLLVVDDPDGRNYRVLEGNRRVACIRLLGNPAIADGTPIARSMKRLAKAAEPPTRADCAILDDVEEADHWLLIRHTRGHRGAGVQAWNTLAATRFAQQREGKPHDDNVAGLVFLDAVSQGYPDNELLQSLVEFLAEKRLTTVGRLARDQAFRDKFAVSGDKGGPLSFGFPASQLEPIFGHLLNDLATDVTVTTLKQKAQRAAYLQDKVPDPDPKLRLQDPVPLGVAPASAAGSMPSQQPTKPKPKRPRPKAEKPLGNLDLSSLGARTQDLLREFKSLGIERQPNTAGILLRVIIELAVDGYLFETKGKANGEFKDRIRRALRAVDSTDRNDAYQGVRQGLTDGTSILSITTLHGFVHNQDYHPDPATVRAWARNYEPFLQALNDAV